MKYMGHRDLNYSHHLFDVPLDNKLNKKENKCLTICIKSPSWTYLPNVPMLHMLCIIYVLCIKYYTVSKVNFSTSVYTTA